MKTTILLLVLLVFIFKTGDISACSVVYYVDKTSGKIYVANNEDYWYDTKAYIQISPKSKGKFARLWYGWDNFAQGGINEAGLFFDGAVIPEHYIPERYEKPKGNLGDEILANCSTVEQALAYLEMKNIGLKNAHMMIGDNSGNAVVVEWLARNRKVVKIADHKLVMTNFMLSDTSMGNYPCYRYNSINENIKALQESEAEVNLAQVGHVIGQSVQLPQDAGNNKIGGTLYSTFINISDMKFVLVYKLDNNKITKIDLKKEFQNGTKKKIKLE